MNDPESQTAETELHVETEGEAAVERGRTRRRRSRSLASETSVNMDELRELVQLIRENEFTEFELEREGFRVHFRRGIEAIETEGGALNTAPELSVPATSSGVIEPKASPVPSHPGAKAQTEASED